MKTIMVLSIVLLVRLVALATPAQPAPAGNVVTLLQINACEVCDGIRQANATIVIQDIRQSNAWAYVPGTTRPEFPRVELANMATIVQENFCIDCNGVDQRNIALVIQNIDPHAVAMFRDAAPSAPVLPFPLAPRSPPVASLNTVEITQVNTCSDCTDVDQQNFALVIQNLRLEDCYLYVPKSTSLDFPPDALSNIVTIIQDNFCIDCADDLQENLALVIQNINPENVIRVPSQPTDR